MNKYLEAAIAFGEYFIIRGKQILSPLRENTSEQGGILLLRPDMIGDLVCTTPFLRGIRSLYPEHHITMVVSPLVYNMMEPCPYIDELLVYDKKTEGSFFRTNLQRSRNFAKEHLQGRKWDLAVVLSHANPDTYPEAWMALMSGAKRRVAYSETVDALKHKTYLGAYDVYFNDLIFNNSMRHEVESVMGILHHLGAASADDSLELWSTAEDEAAVAVLLETEGLQHGKTKVAVSLSTSNKSKDWPLENYEKVVSELLAKHDVQVILIGAGRYDEEIGERFIKAHPQVHNFIGRTTIRQTIALLRKCAFYLGGDTGPMHIAAYCGIGGAAIYKDPKAFDTNGTVYSAATWFAPWKSSIAVLQPEKYLPGCEHGCGKDSHCIAQISADEVMGELEKQLRMLS